MNYELRIKNYAKVKLYETVFRLIQPQFYILNSQLSRLFTIAEIGHKRREVAPVLFYFNVSCKKNFCVQKLFHIFAGKGADLF